MNTDDTQTGRRLAEAIWVVADADAALGASPEVAARLGLEVRALAARRRQRRLTGWMTTAAAALSIAGGLWWNMGRFTSQPPVDDVTAAAVQDPVSDISDAFFPLRYARVPASDGHIVQLVVPGTTLAAFGIEPTEVEAGGTVLADVFVGEDGLARAVRFIRSSDTQEQIP